MAEDFLRRWTDGAWVPSEEELHAYLDRLLLPGSGHAGKEAVAFLAALSARPFAVDVAAAFVRYVQRRTPPRSLPGGRVAVNIVGTGGGRPTFNISTAAAVVACAAGATVLKSGSRAYSSRSGAMDVLRALGVPIPADHESLASLVEETGIGFVSEGLSSPLLRKLAAAVHPLPWRDVASFINRIGPFLSPYETSGQVLGVARAEHFEPMAQVAEALGARRTWLVHSEIGLDELCSFARNRTRWVDAPRDESAACPHPGTDDIALEPGDLSDLEGGDPAHNAAIVTRIVRGERTGAARDTVVMNAGAVLVVAGTAASLRDGIAAAERAITEGAAADLLTRLVHWTPARAALPGQTITDERVSS